MSKRRKKAPQGVPHLVRQRGKRRYWTGWLGREVSLGTADPIEATKRLNELATERKRAETANSAAKETTLSSLAAQYIEAMQPPRRSPRTAQSIESRVLRFVEFTETVSLVKAEQVTLKIVQQFIDHRARSGASARTINRDVTPIAGMFRFGKRADLVMSHPFTADEYREIRLREPTPAPNLRTLSQVQIDSFLKRAYEMLHVAYASLFELMAGCGARLDEAVHLDVSDINGAAKVIRITPKVGWSTKNYRFREIPASEATLKAARLFVRARTEVSLDRKAIWNQLQRVRIATGLPKFSPHDLRRAWASAMHHRGASLKAISAWLGHGSLAVTERYVRVIDTDGHRYLPR